MESKDLKQEMDLLINSEKEVKIGDKKVVVHKISMVNSIKLAGHLSIIANLMINNADDASKALSMLNITEGNVSSTEELSTIRLYGLVQMLAVIGTEGAEIISDVVEKCTNLTPEEVNEISAEDGIDLLGEIYEVNKSFFTKLSKKLNEKLTKATKKEETAKKTKKA